MIKNTIKFIIKCIIYLGFPITFLSSLWLKLVRKFAMGRLEEGIFMALGVYPLIDHYYEPMINPKKHLLKSLSDDRDLPGIDFNTTEQLALLSKFSYNDELVKIPLNEDLAGSFYYDNNYYGSGDAEYLYSMVRYFKPEKIVEIGSGYSTLMVQNAIVKNNEEDDAYKCKHICVEPYEQPWLEKQDVEVIRKRVETLDKSLFQSLNENDILFIDSTHVIRPQGDVVFEYLEVLPILKPGVLIHIHDIFMPKDYPADWVCKEHRLWNEQYLLEAFLSFNKNFKILGSLNYLAHHYNNELADKSPIFREQPGREPGAFWMVKII